MHLWQMRLLSVGLATLHPQGQLNRQPQCSSEPQASCTYEQKVSNAAWIPRWFECSFRWEHFDAAKFCHLDIKWVMQQICCSATVNFLFSFFFVAFKRPLSISIYISECTCISMNQHQNKTKKKSVAKQCHPHVIFKLIKHLVDWHCGKLKWEICSFSLFRCFLSVLECGETGVLQVVL